MHWLAGDSRNHLSHHAYGSTYDGFSKELESSSSANDGQAIIKISSNPREAMKLVP
jgi:hypothetical protein